MTVTCIIAPGGVGIRTPKETVPQHYSQTYIYWTRKNMGISSIYHLIRYKAFKELRTVFSVRTSVCKLASWRSFTILPGSQPHGNMWGFFVVFIFLRFEVGVAVRKSQLLVRKANFLRCFTLPDIKCTMCSGCFCSCSHRFSYALMLKHRRVQKQFDIKDNSIYLSSK